MNRDKKIQPGAAPSGEGWKRDLLILCLFAVLGSAIYSNCFSNSFHYDDEAVVVYNRNIQSLKNIPDFFTNPEMISADPHITRHYRPLVVLSYAINYAMGGLNPVGYHVVNLVFHVGTAFLVFLIVKAMLGGGAEEVRSQKSEDGRQIQEARGTFFAAVAAGLIFLVHPFNSEAVNYITARFGLMSGFFYLLAFYCWVRYRGVAATSYYVACILSFIAAMLSKEVAVTLPAVLWLYDLYFGERGVKPAATSGERRLKPAATAGMAKAAARRDQRAVFRTLFYWRTYVPYLPFVLIVMLPYLVIRLLTFGNVVEPYQRDMTTQFLTELPVLVKHWQMFIIPAPLTPFHDVGIQKTFWSFEVIVSTFLLTAYVATALILAVRSSHPWRMVSFFMFWFFIVLSPTTIVPLNAIFQENRGYLAVVSFVVLIGVAAGDLLSRTKIQQGAIAIIALLIVIHSVVTFQRNKIWKDELSLWSDAAKKAPSAPEVYTALGVAYRRAGMYNQAIEASGKALELGGHNNFFVHDTLGRIYVAQEKWEMAAHEFETSIHIYPYKSDSHNELGTAYYNLGKIDLAEKEFLAAVKLDPRFYRPYFNLGIIYTKNGRIEEAMQAYQKAVSLNPEHLRSWLHLGILAESRGRNAEAADCYRRVLLGKGEKSENMIQESRSRLASMGEAF